MPRTPQIAALPGSTPMGFAQAAPTNVQIIMTVHAVARGVQVAPFADMDAARAAALRLAPAGFREYKSENGVMFEGAGRTIFLTRVVGSALTTVY